VKELPRAEHCAVLEEMFPGWPAAELFQPHTPQDDAHSKSLLKELLRQRHLQTYRTFRAGYDDAARQVNSTLVGRYPTERQFYGWMSGETITLPFPDHRMLLEAMFPGYTIQQLIGPCEVGKEASRTLTARTPSTDHHDSEYFHRSSTPQDPKIIEQLGPSDTNTTRAAPMGDKEPVGDESEEGDRMLRREVLASSLAMGLSAALPAIFPDRRVDSDIIDQLYARNARMRHIDDFLGGMETYRLYKAELDFTIKIFREKSHRESIGLALLTVMAEQAQQTGWAAFDAGNDQIARHFFKLALSAAQEGKNSSLAGNALAFMAYQEVSLGRSGVDLAVASCTAIGPDAPETVRALLCERRAWVHAKAGQPADAERALAQASEMLNSDSTQLQPDWASWVDDCEIKIMTGRCWSELHRPLRAVEPLESALVDFDDTRARDKALYLSWLADAYLDGGEVEQAALTICRAMDLSAGVGSVRPRRRIKDVMKRLMSHRKTEPVANALDRAATLFHRQPE
jgi:tetratricopeptide (TPR) repeat protein